MSNVEGGKNEATRRLRVLGWWHYLPLPALLAARVLLMASTGEWDVAELVFIFQAGLLGAIVANAYLMHGATAHGMKRQQEEGMRAVVRCECGWSTETGPDQFRAAAAHHIEFECELHKHGRAN